MTKIFIGLMSVMLLSHGTLALSTAAQEGQPYKFNPANKSKPGVSVEIMEALEKENPKIKFEGKTNSIPLKRIEKMLAAGELDVFFGLIKNKQRAAVIKFPENGVIYELFSRVAGGIDEKENPKDLNDLMKISKTSPVSASMNTSFVQTLENNGVIVDTAGKDDLTNLKKILKKRTRFFFTGDANLNTHLKNPEFAGKIKVLDAAFSTEEMYAAFSPKVPEEQVKMITEGIKKLREKKVIEQIMKKY